MMRFPQRRAPIAKAKSGKRAAHNAKRAKGFAFSPRPLYLAFSIISFRVATKKHIAPAIGFAHEILQRLAGIMALVAENGDFETIIDQLLQRFSRKPRTQNEKSFASALYSIASLSAPVSHRARIASSSSASAFAIASSPVTTVMFRMLSMFIFIFLQNNPPTGTSMNHASSAGIFRARATFL